MFKKKLLIFLTTAFLLILTNLGFLENANALTLTEEHYNTSFQDFLDNPNHSEAVESDKLGTIASPIKITGTLGVTEASTSYDPRPNQVTAIKDQLINGPDWVFAGIGSLESNLLKSGISSDFSERHLMNNSLYDLDFSQGGNREMAVSYLNRYYGPVLETDEIPYDPPSNDTNGFMNDKVNRHVQDVFFIPDNDREGIQRAIIENGAVASTVYWNSSSYFPLNNSYYYNGSKTGNHSILIVGWDDNYSKTNFLNEPAGNGAFLVKDSWGTSSHDNGYYYISYYDSTIGKNNYVVATTQEPTNYKHMYQYDQLGWTTSAGLGSGNFAWFANVFTPVNGATEQLEAVAFYTKTPNASYELYVNSDFYATGFVGMVLVKQGTFEKPGYHTIKLDSPIKLKNNRRFAIAVKLTTPGSNYPIPIENPIPGYSSNAASNDAESFMSDSGQPSSWIDLKETNLPNANVCLKAFTNEAPPQISISPTSYTVAENGGSITLTINRSVNTYGPLTVNYATSNGTASAGSDYTPVSGTITFADGEISKTISIPILDDSIFEPAESFNLTLSNPSKGILISANATIQIIDNDAQIAFNPSTYNVDENVGAVTLTIARTQNTSDTLSIEYITVNGSATEGSDYTTTSGTVTFAAGETTRTISVPIINDSLYEPSESFTVTLSNPSNGSITQSVATVNIVDNDPKPIISFNPTNYTVAENNGYVTLIINRTQNTSGPLTVNYTTLNGTATEGSDYTNTSGSIVFADGEITKTISVPILDNNIYELNKSFTVKLTSVSVGDITSATATVNITENDPAPQLAFNPTTYTVDEGSGYIILTIGRTGNIAGNLSVNYTTSNATAIAGSDYTATSGTITFADGETTKTISVPIIDDSLHDPNESFNVKLSNPSNGSIVNGTATVTITDNDTAPEMTFNPVDYTVNENGGQVTLIINRTQNTAGPLTINYTTSNGTATVGNDFAATSGIITFADGETSKTISVSIIDDNILESNERFTVTLSNPSNGITTNATATVTISDNDAQISIIPTNYSVVEDGGSVTLTVYRDHYTVGTLSVDYTTSNDTAMAGSDYETKSGTITFTDGETSKDITIPILNDSLYDPNENFIVTLSNPSSGLIVGGSANIDIIDNDLAPEVHFGPVDYTVRENDGTVVLTVYRTQNPAGSMSVNYSTHDGTAKSGSDFTATNGTITFTDGETKKSLSIIVIDDGLYEGNKSFSITLTNPSNGSVKDGVATITITDNDLQPLINFSLQETSVSENESLVILGVNRSINTNGSLTVNFNTVDGTALSGSDFTQTIGSLTFNDGETYKTITIPILDDNIVESEESFKIKIFDTNDSNISYTEVTIKIISEDLLPIVQFKQSNYIIGERGGTATLTVERSGNLDSISTVQYKTTDDTALQGLDYVDSQGTLVFNQGVKIATITLTILDDSQIEGTENVKLVLSDPGNCVIESSLATVEILDNESPTIVEETDPDIKWTGSWFAQSISNANAGGTRASTVGEIIDDSQHAIYYSGNWLNVSGNPYINGTRHYTTPGPKEEGQKSALISYTGVWEMGTGNKLTTLVNSGSMVDENSTSIRWDGDWAVVTDTKAKGSSLKYSLGINTQEDSSTSIVWSGSWGTASDSKASGGSYRYANYTGSKATWQFYGNEITWYTIKAANRGIAKVHIDGSLVDTVDLYNATTLYKIPITYTVTNGNHSITVEYTGTKNSKSTGWNIDVDAFSTPYSSNASFTFKGNQIKWYTTTGNDHGIAEVYIDNLLIDRVDLYSSDTQWNVVKIYNIDAGKHTITIKNSLNKNIASIGNRIDIDCFEVPQDSGTASYTFIGPKISWEAKTGPDCGIIEVYIDNILVDQVDLYSPTASSFSKDYLVHLHIPHTITLRNTNRKNELSIGTMFPFKKFYTAGAYASFTFWGDSVTWYTTKGYDQGTANVYIDNELIDTVNNYGTYQYRVPFNYTVDPGLHTIVIEPIQGSYTTIDGFGLPGQGSTASFTFDGNTIVWHTLKTSESGIAKVYIDNVLVDTVDLFVNSATKSNFTKRYTTTGGTHIITIEHTGLNSSSAPASRGYARVDVDSFEYYDS